MCIIRRVEAPVFPYRWHEENPSKYLYCVTEHNICVVHNNILYESMLLSLF